jgi:hypothetical protein
MELFFECDGWHLWPLYGFLWQPTSDPPRTPLALLMRRLFESEPEYRSNPRPRALSWHPTTPTALRPLAQGWPRNEAYPGSTSHPPPNHNVVVAGLLRHFPHRPELPHAPFVPFVRFVVQPSAVVQPRRTPTTRNRPQPCGKPWLQARRAVRY